MKIQPGKEAEYAEYVAKNGDPYGAATVQYAERWASLMEAAIITDGRQGETEEGTIRAVAKDLSHAADTEGITGFMYGCAVSGLAHFWVHGEALRRWHNLATQIGHEGENANDSGGVLNPALLSIEAP